MENNPYESAQLLGEYLLFHYGKKEEVLPWPNGPVEALGFTKRTVESLIDEKSFNANSRALDVGCAVGASSFVLGKYFGDVLGVDFSQTFIDAANSLKEKNSFHIHIWWRVIVISKLMLFPKALMAIFLLPLVMR